MQRECLYCDITPASNINYIKSSFFYFKINDVSFVDKIKMDNDFVPLINSYLKSEQYEDCPFNVNEPLTLPNAEHGSSSQINHDQYSVYGRSK